MDLGANKTPIEVIREGAFGGTYFRDIYSGVNKKWYKNSWKEFDQLKNIDKKNYCSDYYDMVLTRKSMVLMRNIAQILGKQGWINNEIDPYGWFQWYFGYWLGKRLKNDERLVKMIKDVGSKFDDYSISPKIRQILLHWSYKLTEKRFF